MEKRAGWKKVCAENTILFETKKYICVRKSIFIAVFIVYRGVKMHVVRCFRR